MTVPVEALEVYLRQQGISEADIGGALSVPVSKNYFLIHDTSHRQINGQAFPTNIDATSWSGNKLTNLKARKGVHIYINRLGHSRTVTDFHADKGLATQFEVRHQKPLFLNVELVQPRRKGVKSIYAIAPSPGFTDAQYDRLALTYIAASTRRGAWLIPAFHCVVDFGVGTHDDPQNFDLNRWTSRLSLLLREIIDTKKEKGDFPANRPIQPTPA
jgi:hypothetical protein